MIQIPARILKKNRDHLVLIDRRWKNRVALEAASQRIHIASSSVRQMQGGLERFHTFGDAEIQTKAQEALGAIEEAQTALEAAWERLAELAAIERAR